jgi:hypothetical protein
MINRIVDMFTFLYSEVTWLAKPVLDLIAGRLQTRAITRVGWREKHFNSHFHYQQLTASTQNLPSGYACNKL